VGDAEGVVGEVVGLTDGLAVVGLPVGAFVVWVGARVGDHVPPSFVGPIEGEKVGKMGDCVGALESASVGAATGDFDLFVGELVGDQVMEK
jgi:hypothetical protein